MLKTGDFVLAVHPLTRTTEVGTVGGNRGGKVMVYFLSAHNGTVESSYYDTANVIAVEFVQRREVAKPALATKKK